MSADEGVADITQLEEEDDDEVTSNGVSTTTTTNCASRELIPSALLITFPSVCIAHRRLHLCHTTHHTPTQTNHHRHIPQCLQYSPTSLSVSYHSPHTPTHSREQSTIILTCYAHRIHAPAR
jgi:hypothetical protein